MPQDTLKKSLSQEVLKLIACATMLVDHIGATLFPNLLFLRIIGRIAFPIYCFLLAEGVYHTKHPRRYALRLTIGMLLAEYPFDFLFFGDWTWRHQSVMVTLLLAFLMAMSMKRTQQLWRKIALILPFALAAELLNTDYGALGVCMVALFVLTRQVPNRTAVQTAMLCLLCILDRNLFEMLCVMAMLPIAFYSGRKAGSSRGVQWAFYLFYPVHLAVLALILRLAG